MGALKLHSPSPTAHAELATSLAPFHRDPFDVMWVAQAQLEALVLVTADKAFASHDIASYDIASYEVAIRCTELAVAGVALPMDQRCREWRWV